MLRAALLALLALAAPISALKLPGSLARPPAGRGRATRPHHAPTVLDVKRGGGGVSSPATPLPSKKVLAAEVVGTAMLTLIGTGSVAAAQFVSGTHQGLFQIAATVSSMPPPPLPPPPPPCPPQPPPASQRNTRAGGLGETELRLHLHLPARLHSGAVAWRWRSPRPAR